MPALLLHSTQLLQKEAPWYFHESMAFKDTDAKEGKGRMTFLMFSFHKSPPCVLNVKWFIMVMVKPFNIFVPIKHHFLG